MLSVALAILLLSSFTIVSAGERGVLLTFGAFQGTVLQPGIHLKVPIIQSVVAMDVRTSKIEVEKSESYSSNLQLVDIHSVVNYNLDPQTVGTIYQQYGLEFENKILIPNIEAAVKQTIAKYSAEDLLAKRAEVQTEIELTIRQAFPGQFIVTKYALVNESFSPEYEKAIEAKQVAQQEAEKAQNELKKAQIDAESRIAQAKGEAEAIAIQSNAIQHGGGADYVKLKYIEKWNGTLPTTMLGNNTPIIDINK